MFVNWELSAIIGQGYAADAGAKEIGQQQNETMKTFIIFKDIITRLTFKMELYYKGY